MQKPETPHLCALADPPALSAVLYNVTVGLIDALTDLAESAQTGTFTRGLSPKGLHDLVTGFDRLLRRSRKFLNCISGIFEGEDSPCRKSMAIRAEFLRSLAHLGEAFIRFPETVKRPSAANVRRAFLDLIDAVNRSVRRLKDLKGRAESAHEHLRTRKPKRSATAGPAEEPRGDRGKSGGATEPNRPRPLPPNVRSWPELDRKVLKLLSEDLDKAWYPESLVEKAALNNVGEAAISKSFTRLRQRGLIEWFVPDNKRRGSKVSAEGLRLAEQLPSVR